MAVGDSVEFNPPQIDVKPFLAKVRRIAEFHLEEIKKDSINLQINYNWNVSAVNVGSVSLVMKEDNFTTVLVELDEAECSMLNRDLAERINEPGCIPVRVISFW